MRLAITCQLACKPQVPCKVLLRADVMCLQRHSTQIDEPLADGSAEAEDASLEVVPEITSTNRTFQRDAPKLPVLQQSVSFEAVDVSGKDRWLGVDGVISKCPLGWDADDVCSPSTIILFVAV